MTFAAPWALLGLALLAGPVLVHLLSRRHARRRVFPSLRFLPAARQQPVARRTLDDRALLALRLGLVTLAVLALARPVARDGASTAPRGSARVVVVDTSASMARVTPAGTRARDEAERLADSLVAEGGEALRVATSEPGAVLPAAAVWLVDRGGGDVVVLTDAQRGTLLPSDIAPLPAAVGVRVRAIMPAGDASAGEAPVPSSARDTLMVQLVFRDDAATDRESLQAAITALAAPVAFRTDARGADARSADARRVDVIVQVDAEASPGTGAPDPTLLPALERVFDDALLREVVARPPTGTRAGDATGAAPPEADAAWLAVPASPDPDGAPVGWLRVASPLVVRLGVPPSHPAAAALVAAALDAVRARRDGPLHEREAAALSPEEITALERPARAASSAPLTVADDTRASAARGLWALVLVALAVEWWWRRRLVAASPQAAAIDEGPGGDAGTGRARA